MESRATQSVRVPVKNLAQVCPNLNVNTLQEAVGWQFLRTNVDGTDEGIEGACKQRGFQMVRPDNDWFPGLDDLREDFHSHEWIFKKTPKFKVSQFSILLDVVVKITQQLLYLKFIFSRYPKISKFQPLLCHLMNQLFCLKLKFKMESLKMYEFKCHLDF